MNQIHAPAVQPGEYQGIPLVEQRVIQRQNSSVLQFLQLLFPVNQVSARSQGVDPVLFLLENDLIVRVFRAGFHGHNITGMPAHAAWHHPVAPVFDQEGGGIAVFEQPVGHMESKIERIHVPGLIRCGHDQIHIILPRLEDFKIRLPGKAMLRHGISLSVNQDPPVPDRSAYRKKHRGMLRPYRRIRLPDPFLSVRSTEGSDLRALSLDNRLGFPVLQIYVCHLCSSFIV